MTALPARKPLRVLVTGAAGNIASPLVFMIAGGAMCGQTQPIDLVLLDIAGMEKAMEGLIMELQDCAYPLVHSVVATTDYKVAFRDVEVAFLVGAKPRGPGMQRKDLLLANAAIFSGQGRALNTYASRNVKVLVVGNPANTNALIAMSNAPDLPKSAFSAMTRLDENRAMSQLAARLRVPVQRIRNVIIWGNHSSTQYPDCNHATLQDFPNPQTQLPIRAAVNDDNWLNGPFIKTVQERGTQIINMRGKSSAASAASAAVDHMRAWLFGTAPGEMVSMAVYSDGSVYGVPEGLIFSFPCVCRNGTFAIVKGLPLSDFSRRMLQTTTDELLEEKAQAFGTAAASTTK